MKDEIRLGLAANSTTMESEDTSTTLPSNKRVSSVNARKWEKVSRNELDDVESYITITLISS